MTLPLSKTCAAWLIALVILPFTAPLAACDLADLLGFGSNHTQSPFSQSLSARSLTRAAIDHALPARPTASRRVSAIDRLQTNRPETDTPRPPFSRWTLPGTSRFRATSLVLRI